MIAGMHEASNRFYGMAIRIGNHPFIEFCGLMNEYIKLCEQAQAAGIDFTQANAHTGLALPMKSFNATYLAEKLGCIYGPSLHSDPEIREAFLEELGLNDAARGTQPQY